jgi:ABC-type polysaccharide/polyol phosphate export permease
MTTSNPSLRDNAEQSAKSDVTRGPRDSADAKMERKYRHLIWAFAKRDLMARYKGTLLGWIWTILVPLARLLVYTLVFAIIFRAVPPPPGNGGDPVFVVWFFPGLVIFTFFASGVTSGMSSLLSASGILGRVYLPSYVPTIGNAAGNAVQGMIEMGLALLLLLAFANVGWSWLAFPIWLVLLFVFCTSVGYLLAVANVYARDVGQIVGVVVQLLFFTSAVMYPPSAIPEQLGSIPLRDLIMLNPVAQFVQSIREVVYELVIPGPAQTLYAVGWTLAVLLAAVVVYRWRGRDVAEVL